MNSSRRAAGILAAPASRTQRVEIASQPRVPGEYARCCVQPWLERFSD